MRGVNLNIFDFDYDLTWVAIFMNADETIYGRFGGRDGAEADKYLTLSGLKNAMRAALAAHRDRQGVGSLFSPGLGKRTAGDEPAKKDSRPLLTVEQFPAAKRLKAGACVHCHQVYDFRREEKKTAGQWNMENVWVYPSPQNLGLSLAPAKGSRVQSVSAGSPTDYSGLTPGDELVSINGQPVASFADVQYALHQAPAQGSLAVSFQRDGKSVTAKVDLPAGWRKSDISWRTSMWGLDPAPNVYGPNLTGAEKQSFGLSEKVLAFRQAQFVPPPTRKAGIQQDDIIIGIDGKALEMTMLQFNAYVRLNYQVGDQVTLNVIRKGERMEVPMTLAGRP